MMKVPEGKEISPPTCACLPCNSTGMGESHEAVRGLFDRKGPVDLREIAFLILDGHSELALWQPGKRLVQRKLPDAVTPGFEPLRQVLARGDAVDWEVRRHREAVHVQ